MKCSRLDITAKTRQEENAMRLPSQSEKKSMLKNLRPRFIKRVNSEKDSWEELTAKEKKEVDRLCRQYYSMLEF